MDKKPFDIFGLHSGSPLTGDFSTFAAEIGNVIWAWNNLHGSICNIFCLLSGMENPKFAVSIWHSIKSDKGQRDMLNALVLSNISVIPYGPADFKSRQFHHALNELVWLYKEIGQISAYRNDATHTMWSKETDSVIDYQSYTLPKAIPDTVRGNPRGKRMGERNANELFRSLANYSYELSQYCNFIDSWILMWDDSAIFRDRPIRPQILLNQNPMQIRTRPDPL